MTLQSLQGLHRACREEWTRRLEELGKLYLLSLVDKWRPNRCLMGERVM